MNAIRLLNLDMVSPVRSQTVYHAVAYAMDDDTPDTILMVTTSQPYVCIGYHQDLEQEVDVEYCRIHGLPMVRREVGGGAVYLDSNQLFIQWVFRQGRLPASLEERFALYARPLVETYQALGIAAYLRPINDIHVAGKKIGGTGAAQMGVAEVVVGSLMFDFDKATMARVLRVSSEKMRDKISASLEQYMTTMKELLPALPERAAVIALYTQMASRALQREITPGAWTAGEEACAVALDERFQSEDWLYQKRAARPPSVKIHQDVRVAEGVYKAPGGLIRAFCQLHREHIAEVSLSGDFTMFPASALAALEQAMVGAPLESWALEQRVAAVYQALRIQSPGVLPEHFAAAILAAGDPQVRKP